MSSLSQKHCIPCEGGVPPMDPNQVQVLLAEIPDWDVADDDVSAIYREFTFKNFAEALAFINKVGELAEAENHHPDIHLENYKHIRLELSTHAVGGLSENDFVLAAKIDELA